MCVRGAAKFRRVYVCLRNESSSSLADARGEILTAFVFLGFFSPCVSVCVCVSVRVCVCARACVGCHPGFFFISACYQGDISHFHLPGVPTFIVLSSNRQEAALKSISHLCFRP